MSKPDIRPVVRAALDKLAADRPTPNAALNYTIGGTIEEDVHAIESAAREAAIDHGETRLVSASTKPRRDYQSAEPDARTEYIRIQREAARCVKPHMRSR